MNMEEIDISAILSLSNKESLFRSFINVYITFDRGLAHFLLMYLKELNGFLQHLYMDFRNYTCKIIISFSKCSMLILYPDS